MKKPNVVFITIDSLRPDHLSVNGYARATTPNIDRLIKGGSLRGTLSYTVSPSTMGAFPAIMTSTRPLSYGGFDHGAFGRPPTIANLLGQHGYATAHLCTMHWASSLFGYGDHLDAELLLVDLAILANTGPVMLASSFKDHEQGIIDFDALCSTCMPVIDRHLTGMVRAIGQIAASHRNHHRHFANSRFGNVQYDWAKVDQAYRRAQASFADDPARFIARAAAAAAERRLDYSWILGCEWRQLRSTGNKASVAIRRAVSRLCAMAPGVVDARIRYPHKLNPDAEDVVDAVLRTAARFKLDDRPFYIWTHLNDCHIPFACGSGRGWVRDSARWLRRVGCKPEIDPMVGFGARPTRAEDAGDWVALYDASIAFLDEHIGRLRSCLDAMGLSDTIIAISSDHGEEFGEHGDFGHKFRPYEHNARVETLVAHPDLAETRIPGMTTVMDIAPTFASLTGIRPHEAWEGAAFDVLKTQPRSEIMIEGFFGSPCHLLRRPPYFALRRDDWKLIWNERVDSMDKLGKSGPQLFDLAKDPGEKVDLAARHPAIVTSLMSPIRQRLDELLRVDAAQRSETPPLNEGTSLAAVE